MNRIELTKEQIEDISEAIELPETRKRDLRKLLAIKMLASGIGRREICSTLGIARSTLHSHVELFREGGIAALTENRYYKPSSSIDEHIESIAQRFEASPPASAKQASHMIEQICGIRLCASQVRNLMLKRLGMRFRKSGSLPGKVDPQMQIEFLEEELEPRLEEARSGERHVYFIDASHFLWGAYADHCWCFERQWIKTASGRKRFNVLGALNAATRKMLHRCTEGSVNAETVCSLLIDIYNAHPCGEISLVLDNVPYQHARIVKEMAAVLGIELLYLPAYSPNLNLIERAWKFVKKRTLANRYYETFESFRAAILECIQEMNTVLRNEMKSLLTLKFQTFET